MGAAMTARLPPPDPRLKARAKAMRGEMTPHERRLWSAMRARMPVSGTHFRRQAVVGRFIADFCCRGARLIVEVDGNQHGEPINRLRDARRTAELEALGYRVMRFSNAEVMSQIESVLDTIAAVLAERMALCESPTPDKSPTPNPSPQVGEGDRQQRGALQ